MQSVRISGLLEQKDLPEQKIEYFPFEEFCQAALTQDEAKLLLILQKADVSINFREGLFGDTLITRLAAQKDVEEYRDAIVFLLDHGARVTEAIYGYAQGGKESGHLEAALALFKLAHARESEISLYRCLLDGLARGGHKNEIYCVLQRMAGALPEVILKSMAFNFGIGGHLEAFDGFLEYVALHYRGQLNNVWLQGAHGFALTRCAEEIEAFKQKARAQDPHYIPIVLTGLLTGYLQLKHQREAQEIFATIQEYHSGSIENALYAMAGGLGQSGQVKEAGVFLKMVGSQYDSHLLKMVIEIFDSFAALGYHVISRNMSEINQILEFLKASKCLDGLEYALKAVGDSLGRCFLGDKAQAFLKKVTKDPVYALYTEKVAPRIIMGFALRANFSVMKKILAIIYHNSSIDLPRALMACAVGCALGGHKQQAYEFLDELRKISLYVFQLAMMGVARIEDATGNCMDYEFLLRMLVEMPVPVSMRVAFLNDFQNSIECYDMDRLMEKANTYRYRKDHFKLNYEQLYALQRSEEVRFLLLHGAALESQKRSPVSFFQRLPEPCLHKVVDFLSPLPMSFGSFQNLWRFFGSRANPKLVMPVTPSFAQMNRQEEKPSSKRMRKAQ